MLKTVNSVNVGDKIFRHGKEYSVKTKKTNMHKDGMKFAVVLICSGGVEFDFPESNTKVEVM